MITVRRATVLGAGSWGTAFAKVLADAGTDVVLWARRPEQAERIERTRRNVEYHPDLILPPSVRATADADAAIADADLVFLAIPSQTLRGNLAQWSASIGPDATLVSLIKGIELGTGKRMTEVISEAAGGRPVPGGGGDRPQPGRRDRGRPGRGDRGRVHRRETGAGDSGGDRDPVSAAVHE